MHQSILMSLGKEASCEPNYSICWGKGGINCFRNTPTGGFSESVIQATSRPFQELQSNCSWNGLI